jgi:hypothetical protein
LIKLVDNLYKNGITPYSKKWCETNLC